MGTTTLQAWVSRARTILQDTTPTRWLDAELAEWGNDAQREIAKYQPKAYTKNLAVVLTANNSLHTLPSDANSLISIDRNMGTGGVTIGSVIRRIEKRILDDQIPEWHNASPSATVKHYIYNPEDPKRFYTYPPQPGTPNYVQMVYAASPADVAIGDAILIDDNYGPSIVDYILYRAYSKDADYALNDERAKGRYGAFIQGLLAYDEARKAVSE